jgi:hypothetical protein
MCFPKSESPRRRAIPVLSKTMKRKKCVPASALPARHRVPAGPPGRLGPTATKSRPRSTSPIFPSPGTLSGPSSASNRVPRLWTLRRHRRPSRPGLRFLPHHQPRPLPRRRRPLLRRPLRRSLLFQLLARGRPLRLPRRPPRLNPRLRWRQWRHDPSHLRLRHPGRRLVPRHPLHRPYGPQSLCRKRRPWRPDRSPQAHHLRQSRLRHE